MQFLGTIILVLVVHVNSFYSLSLCRHVLRICSRLPKFRVGCYLASIWPPSVCASIPCILYNYHEPNVCIKLSTYSNLNLKRSGNLSIRGPSSGGIIRTSEKTKELYVCMHIKQGRDKNGRFQVMQVRSSLVCVMISRTTQTI